MGRSQCLGPRGPPGREPGPGAANVETKIPGGGKGARHQRRRRPDAGVLRIDQVGGDRQRVVENGADATEPEAAAGGVDRPRRVQESVADQHLPARRQAERQRQIVQADVDLVDAGHRGEIRDRGERGRRFDEQHDAGASADEFDESAGLRRRHDHGQHHDASAVRDHRVDLPRRLIVQRIETGEEIGARQRRTDAGQIVQRMRGDPGAEAPLAVRLAEPLQVDADPIDAGGIGPRRQRRVVRPQREDEGVRRRSDTGFRASRAGVATRPDSRSHTDG